MENFKVLMTDTIHKDTIIEKDIIEKAGGTLHLAKSQNPEDLARDIEDCDAVINVFAQMNKEVLDSAKKCKVIVRTGIGYNNIDVKLATENGIMVANVPDYCFDEVADHTLALALSLARKISFLNQRVKAGSWNINEAGYIPRLSGKNFGLFGFGNISKYVARRAQAFGMNVIAFDPYLLDSDFEAAGVTRMKTLNDLAANSDILSLHAPATTENEGSINYGLLQCMKSNSLIINTARGQLINEDDLFKALNEKIIGGAGLDVLCIEPPKFPLDLLTLENVLITPHGGFYSEEAMPSLRKYSAEEIVRTLQNGFPNNWVNKCAMEELSLN